MRAVVVTSLTGPAGLEVLDVPEPATGHLLTPGEGVLVDVRAAAVAFPDVLQSYGRYQVRPDPPFVPGHEVAGVVRSAPAGSGLEPGDSVAAFTMIGGLAERAVAPAFLTFRLPEGLGFAEGAGLILNYHTAVFSLVTRGRLQAGEWVLVHGAAGGVGTAALQVARGLGARTVAVVSSDAKAAVARTAGADEVVRSDGPWRAEVLEATAGGVDLIIDPVGGDTFLDSLRCLREGGRLVVVGFAGGGIPEVKVNRLLLNNIAVVGAGWGAYVVTRPALCREIGQQVADLAGRGFVRPLVGACYPLDRAADAFRLIEAREATGKVVVEVSEA